MVSFRYVTDAAWAASASLSVLLVLALILIVLILGLVLIGILVLILVLILFLLHTVNLLCFQVFPFRDTDSMHASCALYSVRDADGVPVSK